MQATDRVVVVGGGLAGLVAAAFAARGGARVTLYERLSELGGRGRTREERGFRFNMGPHALYLGGHAATVLGELGVAPKGGRVSGSGALGRWGGRLHALPAGSVSLLSTGLLGVAEKLEIARFLKDLPARDWSSLDAASLDGVLERELRGPRSRALVHALVRLSSYCHAPEAISAGAALAQLAASLRGVLYLDGGWQSLVAALRETALRAGVEIRAGQAVRALEHDARARGVVLADGARVPASAVVLTGGPREVSDLVDAGQHPELERHAKGTVPVRAACLDIALTRLPEPKRLFALGIDEATYVSVHSAYADLAPQGAALIQAARYLRPDGSLERAALETELEGLVDALQPGWRSQLVSKRFLRELVVAHDVPRASAGGLAGRPGAAVAGIDGLFLAGDWIGPHGLLADASLASGRAAGLRAAGADVAA
jgi:phytoene dehydrogenase-like protein